MVTSVQLNTGAQDRTDRSKYCGCGRNPKRITAEQARNRDMIRTSRLLLCAGAELSLVTGVLTQESPPESPVALGQRHVYDRPSSSRARWRFGGNEAEPALEDGVKDQLRPMD